MSRLLSSVLSLAFVASVASGASAKVCHDAKGKFMKCPPMAMMASPKPTKCRDAKGKFMKCGTMMHKM